MDQLRDNLIDALADAGDYRGLDAPDNGTWLPASRDSPNPYGRMTHQDYVHDIQQDYVDYVQRHFTDPSTGDFYEGEELLQKLDELKAILENGMWP